MANSLCEIRLIGRLGKDAELKELRNGNSMLIFSMATDKYDPNTQDTVPMWHNCAMFPSNYGKNPMQRIDAVMPYLTKGKQVHISGTFDYWERDDGSKQPSIKVNDIIFLGKKDDDSSSQSNTDPFRAKPSSDEPPF
jgi:single-stranded DNA-binding protein|tara:strand:+ start:187 stop:597 length:411 start_codon:yes stop_codon:yes gene_type:complete